MCWNYFLDGRRVTKIAVWSTAVSLDNPLTAFLPLFFIFPLPFDLARLCTLILINVVNHQSERTHICLHDSPGDNST